MFGGRLVAAGDHGYQFHRFQRAPGTHPLVWGQFFALTERPGEADGMTRHERVSTRWRAPTRRRGGLTGSRGRARRMTSFPRLRRQSLQHAREGDGRRPPRLAHLRDTARNLPPRHSTAIQ
jgi:hypothetical protein